ncbi:MAG TPA: MBL fold metallo-hydrolase, partial [Gammaproteobacteria bacterium]|nr:MBL fold metallo-hydrolase [Gammaproteobacteria bacterium]
MLIFRQLFDPQSSTYTYLLGELASREALLIDPVFEQVRRDAALIAELGLTLKWTLDTHVHADHVTGAWLLRERLGSRIALARASGAEGADWLLEPGALVRFGSRHLQVRATPGHTSGCVTYVLDDRSMAFTGDAVLIRG